MSSLTPLPPHPYLPVDYQQCGLPEIGPTQMDRTLAPAIVRGLRIVERSVRGSGSAATLVLRADGVAAALEIGGACSMRFDTETINALEYFRRVIERGDHIDAVTRHRLRPGDAIPLAIFWIQIRYVGQAGDTGKFSRKEDGLFALRAKAGEKAERLVTRELATRYGHAFPTELTATPGFFEIRFIGKKKRIVDRRCPACGLTVEIKKRNKDRHYRVSHSPGRPFWDENHEAGWHAFVFPDMKFVFVPNAQIITALRNGQFTPGSDRYDAWADIAPDAVQPSDPPYCVRPEPRSRF